MAGMRPFVLALTLLAVTAAMHPASACGHCVEDRVAAVYDYQVELRAGRDHLRIAYLGIDGPRAESEAAREAIATALRDVPLVERDTLRTSAAPAAASFAWRGSEAELRGAMRTLNAQLAGSGLRAGLLRTWDAQHGLR
jgi:hypothetical protein